MYWARRNTAGTTTRTRPRAHLMATGTAARGCKLEVSQRDVYRINGPADKVRRYVEIIRQALADTWY